MTANRLPTPVMYRVVAGILRPVLRSLMRYEVSGLEHLPRSGGFIVAPNHVSHIDPFPWAHVLYNQGRPPVFLAKSSLFEAPVVRSVMRHTNQVRVDRETVTAARSIGPAVRAIEAGACVAVYPEGSLTRDPDLWPMRGKTGAARLALHAGCPVIPIAQWGPQDLLAPYARRPTPTRRRTLVRIRFGPPVELADLRSDPVTREAIRTGTDRIMQALTHELEQLRGEKAPAERFDPKAHGLRSTGDYRSGGES
ncbi:lysophospholipid acyltransferase family protein [Janibacter cremeus]|uniref:lysophospholipid acyltransferase family protein n=1 Tax=Janibacter cremeus TaxID=1285192 RepID=UPI0023F79123|nr:lysophospholipid acyltransferase family protein [Janibacter cremeus]WEV78442.1 lysophospholipid acyltransferase family protein [Janibacter cremeus]